MAKDPFAGARHLPKEYHPRNVVLSSDQLGNYIVTDKTYGQEHVSYSGPDRGRATASQKGRQATVKGALTRRANKRQTMRTAAASEAGVTMDWLRSGEHALTHHEADAWLGLDFEARGHEDE